MVSPNYGYGGNVNMIGTGVMDAAFPWATYPSGLAGNLAQSAFGTLGNIYAQQIASAASQANAATQAGATLGAAGISAQSGVDQQLISTNGMLKATQAQIQADLVKAAAGDLAAMARLKQEQAFLAQLENNKNKLEVAKLMGSGSLFDNIAARFAVSGMGDLPAMGGAFAKGGGLQNVTVPSGYSSPSIESLLAHLPNVGTVSSPGTNYTSGINIPMGGGGGGFGGGLNMGNIFTDILGAVNAGLPQTFQQAPAPAAPAAPVAPTPAAPTPAPSVAATQAKWEEILANPNAYLAGGGRVPKTGALVGEAGPEALIPERGGFRVVPLTPMQTGGRVDQYGNPDGIRVDQFGNPGGVAPAPTAPAPTVWNPSVQPVASGSIMAPSSKTTAAMQAAGVGRFGSTPQAPVSTTPPAPDVPPAAPLPDDTTNNGRSVPLGNVAGDGSRDGGGAGAGGATGTGNGVLSDIDMLPAFQQLRNRNAIGSIYALPELSRPELGISALPSPFSVGPTFLQMSPADQQNALEGYQALFGITPQDFFQMMYSATPGYRRFGAPALQF